MKTKFSFKQQFRTAFVQLALGFLFVFVAFLNLFTIDKIAKLAPFSGNVFLLILFIGFLLCHILVLPYVFGHRFSKFLNAFGELGIFFIPIVWSLFLLFLDMSDIGILGTHFTGIVTSYSVLILFVILVLLFRRRTLAGSVLVFAK